ncbi:MAG TPA: hypothetical protein VMK12_26435 [Anaeromyxobacteraceae bacterium]|nr:hypothetical protein [Anaeromyxobacteraceae bacterium]
MGIAVRVSHWLYLCALQLAPPLTQEKRCAELSLLENGAGEH